VHLGAVGGLDPFALDPLSGRADLALRLQRDALRFQAAMVDPRVNVEFRQPLKKTRPDPKSGSRHRLPSSIPPQHLRGHTEGPEERPSHAFAVSKTRFLRHDINRVPPFLHHEPGRFQPKPLHCFCR
jgi:hypothetical protein